MKCKSKYLIVIFVFLVVGCSQKKNKLIVDEIYISKHVVGVPLAKIKYKFPYDKLGENPAHDSLYYFNPRKSINISKSSYKPRLIIKVTQDRRIIGYINNFEETEEGYFSFIASDSLLNYLNREIENMDYRKLDTFYYKEMHGEYTSSQYFISIKNGDEEKQILILNKYACSKNVTDFIDDLYNYAGSFKLSKSIGKYFRKDTLIVLKSEYFYDLILNKRYSGQK